MKRIPLTQGKEALVSDEDYEYLMQWKWRFHKSRDRGGYAKRTGPRPRQTTIFMHDVVASRKGFAGSVDHHDQNKLNNQRWNIRQASSSQNKANCAGHQDNTSGFKGVDWHVRAGKWRARMLVNGKYFHLGLWMTKEEGARAYNKAAREHFGEYAWLNRIEQRRGYDAPVVVERRSGRERRNLLGDKDRW